MRTRPPPSPPAAHHETRARHSSVFVRTGGAEVDAFASPQVIGVDDQVAHVKDLSVLLLSGPLRADLADAPLAPSSER